MRSTTAALWEQEIYVGKVNTYTLKDVPWTMSGSA